MSIFLNTLLQTFVFRIFSVAYPISLKFLYEEKKFFNFYLTIIIILLSIIYFIFFYLYIINHHKDKKTCLKCYYRTKQYSYFLVGYLVQLNLAFLDTYEIKDGNLKINKILFILKILMILETMKRIYYYAKGIKLLISLEYEAKDQEKGEGYYMTFEIINGYFWYNVYSNFCAGGYDLPKSYLYFGLFVTILHGILAMGCYFLVVKICFGVLNLIYLSAHIYTIIWSIKEYLKYNY